MAILPTATRVFAFSLLLLAGCASNVTYAPSNFAPLASDASPHVIKLDKQVEIRLPTGYTRTLKAGSQWRFAGTVAQGDVYRAYQDVFTLEGAHVHEAYLVVASDYLTGFYLPVEHGFSPLDQKISFTFHQ
ncbi:hypothetical protein [Undibacterium terreum]|uniref:Lipoprotein n=1 Tax=Undibacterium terreum TaxID=1224302 RepID=A0A916UDD4_9BURK|nr:hypothetical protein [Undibacterium terreum]GGC68890.1 hypothetical protein GCM10011396_14850 [Undibacterium terreum]